MSSLVLKRASTSRSPGETTSSTCLLMASSSAHHEGRVARAASALGIGRGHGRAGRQPWLWTLAFGYHEDPRPTHSYEPTREATMAAFAKSWRRE